MVILMKEGTLKGYPDRVRDVIMHHMAQLAIKFNSEGTTEAKSFTVCCALFTDEQCVWKINFELKDNMIIVSSIISLTEAEYDLLLLAVSGIEDQCLN